MIEIQKHTDNTMESSFQERIVLENFYSGAGRGELLARMKGAVESGAPLMVLSGDEGIGKTMLCRMLESECQSSIIVLFFPSTVESFEDVVRIVAQRLGLQLSATDEGKSVETTIELIIAHLLRQSSRLLIIFDEAEDIYLATLERIRKLLDRTTAAGARIQILFSGRKTFLENCAQLAICDFRNTEDLNFDVLPLTEQETSDYLSEYLGRLDKPDKKVFSDEEVRNIHGKAKGKFRKINLLADESLRPHGDETSFMVLLESFKDEADIEKDKQKSALSAFGRAVPYMCWFGGALCTLLLLFFLLQPGEKRRAIKPVSLPPPNETAKIETVVQDGGGQQQPAVQPVMEPINQQPTQHEEISQKHPETVGENVPGEPEGSIPATMQVSGATEKIQEIAVQPPAIVQPMTEKETEPLPASIQNKLVTAVEIKVPELRQIPPLKVKPAYQPEPSTGAAKLLPRMEVQEAVGVQTVDQLYQKRLNAGIGWVSGEKNDKFTVQLMVLTAKNAEQNLKKMLAQPNYRQEVGNFFIFKKNESPEIVLVFYGEYSTIELARLAQNSLPSFLQIHQPYAISVKGAIAKIGK
ncbi:MAG: AAA family ATPase [Proteobacteria bacterium]|nr:AAA family ATPase [Pseudomonadota bacterium]